VSAIDPPDDTDPQEPIRAERVARVRAMLTRRLSTVVGVVEAVHRRHNTSAILRSCEAFGVHEVHMVTGPFRPAKGAARGAERWLELHPHETVTPCIEGLQARGFRVYVADLDDRAVTPDAVPVDGPVAILFGSEMSGVSGAARAAADGAVIVPMWGLTASLNVSVAAACILQRVTTRRRAAIGAEGDLDAGRQQAFFEDWLVREQEARRGRRARLLVP
jgi:tRNA (guanosine-2'-O-)-methyltransferase